MTGTKPRGKRQRITVRVPEPENTREIEATAYGPLAIHPVVTPSGSSDFYWSITHVPTMYRIPGLFLLGKETVRTICKTLLATDIDWEHIAPPVPREAARKIRAVLKPWAVFE